MSARILIIEDNPANMDLMAYLLQAFGHGTLQAVDGEQGLEMTRREFPDLVICDIHLPRMDGYGVMHGIKSDPILKRIPVVAVTALAMVGDREKLLSEGFDAYLSKPIEPETFVAQVEQFLAQGKRSDGCPQRMEDAQEPAAPVLASRSASILVVDDTAVNSELIRSTLEPFGYQLTLAGGAQEGLRQARLSQFDLILSDLHMPEEDGFSFIRAIKADEKLNTIPFMFLSSSFGSAEDRERCIALGAAYFIRRPIEPQALLGHIEACLKGQLNRGSDGNHSYR